jgi:carbonic anhydrase
MSISIKYPLWILLIGISSCKPISKPTISSVEAHISPEKALAYLLAGNERYMNDHPIHPDQTLSRIRDLKKGQHPFAVVVSCSDSRVPPELIFDQGLGDIFVIRTAGNIIGEYELGSIEYAIEHLKAHLIVVLGHDNCGAVSAFIEHKHNKLDNHIQAIIDYIKAEPEQAEIKRT